MKITEIFIFLFFLFFFSFFLLTLSFYFSPPNNRSTSQTSPSLSFEDTSRTLRLRFGLYPFIFTYIHSQKCSVLPSFRLPRPPFAASDSTLLLLLRLPLLPVALSTRLPVSFLDNFFFQKFFFIWSIYNALSRFYCLLD